jgi:hypothetical protein
VTPEKPSPQTDWQDFIREHGWRVQHRWLSTILGRTDEEVLKARESGAVTRHATPKSYVELFSLWHGRPPEETEWPALKKSRRGTYPWTTPELTLLATLVGTMGVNEISVALTKRLCLVTQDPMAERSPMSVQNQITRIGLQSDDLVGGITTTQAGREVGSLSLINQAIHKKELQVVAVGRRWKIPHAAWEAWKSTRVFAPEGYVQLSSIREKLAIKSDKLSEFAGMGLIPTAIRCNPYGASIKTTKFGTWFVQADVAKQLVADRHAGRPMPWHGKALPSNLKATFKLWEKRKHPQECTTCALLWGEMGAPTTFEDYQQRYPVLAHGAKRHLTREWSPGLTLSEVAQHAGSTLDAVSAAIANGVLESQSIGNTTYVSKTDATRWLTRKCPTGDSRVSWLSVEFAAKQYMFTIAEIRRHIADGALQSKVGTDGAQRGIVLVGKNQCAQLRERLGFTEVEAAARVGVSVPRFRLLLNGVNWRQAEGIPLATVQAVIKRLKSREGYTIEEAADKLGITTQWVHEQIQLGTVRVQQAKWDRRRIYITEPMLKRLEEAMNAGQKPLRPEELGDDWIILGEAAIVCGVSMTTMIRWTKEGTLKRKQSTTGWRYHREGVKARARIYWESARYRRPIQPQWLKDEWSAAGRSQIVSGPQVHKRQPQ